MSSSAALMEHVEPTNSGRDLLGSKDPPESMGPYAISEQSLTDMNAAKDMTAFQDHGGVEGLAKKLCSDVNSGLSTTVGPDSERSVEAHRLHFGANTYPVTPPRAFFAILFEALKDPILILLMVAALISTVLGSAIPEQRHKQEWIDGVAIWIAVGVVSCVGATNDYQKDKQFRKLNDQRDVFMIKTIRNGAECLVVNTDLVVGDIVVLDAGDKVVADGVCIQVFGLIVDEASLTGESEPIHKTLTEDPWVRSGTQVSEGSGQMLVTAVGIRSDWGKVLMLMEESEDENTPLQDKLEVVAGVIGKIGVGVAIACFVALFVKWLIVNKGFNKDQINEGGPIEFFMFAITIIVVAVPEGLPLAVTISLAYSMKKMMKDNNFVRVLAACETMGGATAICSDKTGTLTQNRMTVTQGWFSGRSMPQCPEASELKPELLQELKMNIAMNAKAFLIPGTKGGPTEFVGSRTECALLVLLQSWGINYDDVRTEFKDRLFKMFGFSSDKKMSSCLIKYDDKIRLYNKGAAEWVLQRCHHMLNEYGDIVPLDEAEIASLNTTVTDMAKCGLRCIALAYTDYPLEDPLRPDDFFEFSDNVDQNLILSCIVGIKDPLRPEVIDAVATCQKAGIVVRMVTGDNIHTARHIAAECGILFDDNMAMEGPVFRSMAANDLLPLLPKLRVLARSSPKDKLTLVQLLKQQGEVVAVTGDGTNDAPALKESDVGLAMGIAGTEVAKEAADIIIMDDNFSSIVKSVLWGRSVFNNIRKFLQFQLTVNVVALVISFIGAVVGGDEPLNILQLLWVNLIMDTMGALALATELPHPDLLLQMPNGREEALITMRMWKHIIIQSVYQLFWLFLFIFALPNVGWKRYTKISDVDFYNRYCVSFSTNYAQWNATYSASICNGLEQCGFPLGSNQQSDACWLYRDTWRAEGQPVPSDMRLAFCGPNTTAVCQYYVDAAMMKDFMAVNLQSQNDEAKRNYLSVLFNTFIFMQLFNEICARRINDEYTIFEGLHKSPIFLAVIGISIGIQIIIVELLGSFFKVTPQNGVEWIVAIAIGAGSVPVSLLTRFISRAIVRNQVRPTTTENRGIKHQPPSPSPYGGGGGSGTHDRQSRQSSDQHLTSVEKF